MNTPCGRDIVRELTKVPPPGLRMRYCYSIMDWHHPITPAPVVGQAPRGWLRYGYREYMKEAFMSLLLVWLR